MLARRQLLSTAALATAGVALGLPLFSSAARAQEMFSSLNVFIPAGPGGGWDGLGRAIEQVARQAGMVGTFQFENVGGAGGTVGLPRFVAQRRGRGDAIIVGGAIMVGAVLANRSPIGLKDTTPLARMTTEPSVIVVPANSDIKDIKGLLAALKDNPGATSVAGGSAGGIDHIILGLMLKSQGRSAKDASYVAFAGGGPAQAAILGAQVKAGISGISEFAEQVKAGRMRALATTGDKTSLEGVPTLKESGIDIVMGNWRGIFGPPGMKPADKEKMVKFLTDLDAAPGWREMCERQGWDRAFLAGDAFANFLKEDEAATATVLKEVGLV
ncbi:tripartite tricarboxylate transporter substrate binding protein [Pseudoroseomonas wenyumeiae]|uniref:Tripartite tricarboxylate transporter substrate binding protein n=1 Tax=Teichococcus wenyumeiae TaxID=2478470 RepID=A0A3A9JL78_9PROT|nr:tripartite tricarboxylate transporter substrate-binding protein [Pseudoroseomonas wenyumeiae]RKK01318.1 tripartite tricarboxylate transporter substrate binding protein [Pseudoroseomonas wenyumeiae]RMI25227.1 tripartite tricarboxylate transporter substrate binding protein [Pseudoroseomonas wenyumeiae]